MIDKIIKKVVPIDIEWTQKAEAYLDSLAMPPGALGLIHETAIKLAAIQKTLQPKLRKRSLVMACADHGVAEEGVSAYPQITDAIVKTALHGGAAINAFCRQSQTELIIVDVGVKGSISMSDSLPKARRFIQNRIASGTANMLHQAAMTKAECEEAILTGIKVANDLNADVIGLGEMGIGNTTSASCLMAKLMDLNAEEVTGPGTGVQGDALEQKKRVVQQILERTSNLSDPFEILRHVGGLEIATLVGVILGATSQAKAVVLDGFISGSAALVAVALAPACQDYLFAGHQSAEPAHARMLAELDLKPLLQLDMRLGEGTGAALAMNSLETACEVLGSMMKLDEALKLP